MKKYSRDLIDQTLWTAVVLMALYWISVLCGGCTVPKTEYGIRGLNTAQNPQAGVPPGALSDADNVIINRVGMVEPRPGFKLGAATSLTEIWKLIPYDGDFFAVGNGGATRWSNNTAADALWTKHYARAVESRKNLYLTTTDAVRKFTGANDTTADRAGLTPPPGGLGTLAAGSNILINQSYAWRYLIRRTDANNVVVRSAPSSRIVVYNDSGGNRSAVLSLLLGVAGGYQAGDVLEAYRSYGTLVVGLPSDELFLQSEHTITAGEITAGIVTITDTLTDLQLGVALYTNATQEGIKRSNFQPPRARDLALFNGSLFAADITYPHTMELSFLQGSDLSGSATGVGFRQYNGTRTNGSNQITGLSSTVGLEIGQTVANNPASWSGTLPIRITTIVGATLTMSETWNGATDGAPVALTFNDSIRIKTGSEDKYYNAGSVATFAGALTTDVYTASRFTHSAFTTVQTLGNGLLSNAAGLPIAGTQATIRLFQLLPTTAGFQVWATHGADYNPVLPATAAGTGATSTQDAFPNAVAWSKNDEPEHFMAGQIWFVGNARAPILRVWALEDALYIFKGKGDGVYRLSGFGERSGWNVTQLDPTAYLLHSELITAQGGQSDAAIYAWTNCGMSRVTAAGAQVLSNPILNLVDVPQNILDPSAATQAFAWAASNLPSNQVIFALPASNADGDNADQAWVFNTVTNAWTSWFASDMTPYAMVLNPKTNLLLTGGATGTPSVQRGPTEDVQQADNEYAVTVSAAAALNVTITGGSGWTPAVGDLLKVGATYATVTAITDATHFAVDVTITTGASTAYKAFLSTLTWLPKVDPSGAVLKQFQDVVIHWDDVFGLQRWTVNFNGTRGHSLDRFYTRAMARAHVRAETRAMTTPAVALDQQLYVTLQVKDADARWRVSGISENAQIVSTRVAR